MILAKRNTIHVRAPKDIINELRLRFPGMTDENRIRVMYHSSAIRAEAGLRKANFKDKLGKALWGKHVWNIFKR